MTSHIELKATENKVHSVTVFQADRAEVVRYFNVDLKGGQNEVDISQLPTILDEDSIRVDGIGGKAIIADVVYHPPTSNDSDKKHQKAVEELQKQKEELERKLAVFKRQESILDTYSGTLKGADTAASKLNEFLDIYAARQSTIDEKKTELSDQITAINEDITQERKVWSADNEGKKRAVRITVVVVAEDDGPAEISVTYLVSQASWTPLYDLRAFIGRDKTDISLQYRATIAQSTGEDWKEVNLTLSTASPQIGSAIPKLNPQWVNVIQPMVFRKAKSKSIALRSSAPAPMSAPAPGGAGMAYYSIAEEGSTLGGGGFRVPEALAVEGTMSTSFVIDGLSTIPSDTDTASQAHKVNIAVIDLTADLEWISVPKEAPSAFLQAKVKNNSTYLLLPGRANIFLDDNFVAKSEIEHVSPNESFNCSLGADPQVKITYHPRSKKNRSQGGILQSRTITNAYHQKISIKNTRSATVKRLLVRDQIPVSSDQRIKVALVEPSNIEFPNRTIGASGGGSLTEKALQVPKEVQISKTVSIRWKVSEQEEADASSTPGSDGAREGMLEWVCEIGSGQSTDLNLAWEVTAPAGTNWGPQ